MPRESKAKKRERAIEFCAKMDELYPDPKPALDFNDPFECVIAVSLSAQTTDANVNKVTPEVFNRWGTPEKMAQADVDELEKVIWSIGFHRNKAKNCVNCAKMIMSDFAGEVPDTMEDLQKLPGVGRKTANIVLNKCFGKVEGIAVDTHVFRIAHRLKLSSKNDPSEVEQDLLSILPEDLWKDVNSQWILFGREHCEAKKPKCETCPCLEICPTKDGMK